MADWAGYLDGHPQVITPTMDKLAQQGFAFSNAHCTSPICGPSRAAVMTGLRPETSNIYTNAGNYSDYVPEAVSLPKYFKNHGYYVAGAGKVIHPYNNVIPNAFHDFGPGVGIVGTPFSDQQLSTFAMDPVNEIDLGPGRRPAVLPLNGISTIDRPQNRWSTFDWGPIDVPDREMPDGKITDWIIEKIEEKHVKPFFIAAGLYKPHQPLFAPDEYFELYQGRIQLPKTKANDLDDLPEVAKYYAHAAWTAGKHQTVVKHEQWESGILGYLATISFADAQLGKIIEALENSIYVDNTWIVLWSDHGWHLGEKEHWGKHTAWEESTKVPLIIVPPRSSNYSASEIKTPVNLLDLYPTLLQICNLPANPSLEGKSLVPLFSNSIKPSSPSIITLGRGSQVIATEKWRYIHYFDGSEELYDIQEDPHEFHNLTGSSNYYQIKDELRAFIINDPKHKQYVRKKNWKLIIQDQGPVLLFNLEEPQGIAEQENLAETTS